MIWVYSLLEKKKKKERQYPSNVRNIHFAKYYAIHIERSDVIYSTIATHRLRTA